MVFPSTPQLRGDRVNHIGATVADEERVGTIRQNGRTGAIGDKILLVLHNNRSMDSNVVSPDSFSHIWLVYTFILIIPLMCLHLGHADHIDRHI